MKHSTSLREAIQVPGIPVATVSGIATTNPGMVAWFDRNTSVAIITTKSFQLRPNTGNREPILTEPEPGCFGNAVGLKNPGIVVAIEELAALRREGPLRALLNVSLSGSTPADFVTLARAARPVADILELNYSCPHASAGYGADIGKDEKTVAEITAAIVAAVPDIPVLIKVTPAIPDVGRIASIAVQAGAAGIVAINTAGPLVYRHDETGIPILSNPPDGRGGQSGTWIQSIALQALESIRDAIGPEPFLIGMGGIATAQDAAALYNAGADVVGIGSALSRVHQRLWPAYIRQIAGAPLRTPSEVIVRKEAGMRYQRYTVQERRELGDGLFEIELNRSFPYRPGQTVFLYLPGVGEKPFTPALSEPATFLIKRRGPFTKTLASLQRGDSLYIRGPYGDPHNPTPALRALLIAAGSGIAALPALAEEICRAGGSVKTLIALRQSLTEGTVVKELRAYGPLTMVPDEGKEGRAITLIHQIVTDEGITAIYVVGPRPFMEEAARLLGTRNESPPLFFSLEEPVRCGVGLCGECHHDGDLTCQFGTIVRAPETRR